MRRTPVFRTTLKAAVAVCAAGAALTACGPIKTGAAAIVGHDRITDEKLDSAVSEWTKELPKFPQAQQVVQSAQAQPSGQNPQSVQPYDPSSPQRSALYLLIEMHAWDEVAREQKVATSPGQVDADIARKGGRGDLNTFVVAQGLPTSYSDDFARTLLIQETMLQRYGYNPFATTPDPQRQQAASQRLLGDLDAAKRKLAITVNPRYGTLDAKSQALGPVCPRLSTPDSGTSDGASGEVKCQV
jgi:hypothetical protein